MAMRAYMSIAVRNNMHFVLYCYCRKGRYSANIYLKCRGGVREFDHDERVSTLYVTVDHTLSFHSKVKPICSTNVFLFRTIFYYWRGLTNLSRLQCSLLFSFSCHFLFLLMCSGLWNVWLKSRIPIIVTNQVTNRFIWSKVLSRLNSSWTVKKAATNSVTRTTVFLAHLLLTVPKTV